MRFLHVLDAFEAGRSARALLGLLESRESPGPHGEHDVLALAGGPLQSSFAGLAHRVTAAAGPREVAAALLAGKHDVVHALDLRAAAMVVPIVASGGSSAIAYSAPALRPHRSLSRPRASEESALIAACDVAFVPPDWPPLSDAATSPSIVRLDMRPLALEMPQPLSPRETTFRAGCAREWWAALEAARPSGATRAEGSRP